MTETEWMLKRIKEANLRDRGEHTLCVCLLHELRGRIPAMELFLLTVEVMVRRYNAETGQNLTVSEAMAQARAVTAGLPVGGEE